MLQVHKFKQKGWTLQRMHPLQSLRSMSLGQLGIKPDDQPSTSFKDETGHRGS